MEMGKNTIKIESKNKIRDYKKKPLAFRMRQETACPPCSGQTMQWFPVTEKATAGVGGIGRSQGGWADGDGNKHLELERSALKSDGPVTNEAVNHLLSFERASGLPPPPLKGRKTPVQAAETESAPQWADHLDTSPRRAWAALQDRQLPAKPRGASPRGTGGGNKAAPTGRVRLRGGEGERQAGTCPCLLGTVGIRTLDQPS